MRDGVRSDQACETYKRRYGGLQLRRALLRLGLLLCVSLSACSRQSCCPCQCIGSAKSGWEDRTILTLELGAIPRSLDQEAWRRRLGAFDGRLVSVVGVPTNEIYSGFPAGRGYVMQSREKAQQSFDQIFSEDPLPMDITWAQELAVVLREPVEPEDFTGSVVRVVGRLHLREVFAGRNWLQAWGVIEDARWEHVGELRAYDGP